MSQSKLPKHKHEAYNHRDVASLPPPFTQWSESFEKIQRAHNRILQPGFMHRDVDDVLADAKTAGVEWLTNICCPSAKADIMLHISKEMVVNYQVADKEFNIKAHAVYASLVEDIEDEILESIDIRVNDEMELFKRERAEQIEQAARKMLVDNFKNKDNGPDQEKGLKNEDITLEQLEAAQRVVVDMERRKYMDTIVPKVVKEHLADKAGSLGLAKKTCYPIGETHDFFYGGPAGSGKSTLSKKDLSDDGSDLSKINKKDCVTVATDIYRAFTLPGTEDHEDIPTKDIFTRTQDFAYMVKEQVLNELQGMREERPNLINDGVTVEWAVRGMLQQSQNLVSKVALYRGDEAGYRGIAERALKRAQELDADPADKGRYIETTSLFKGHADASRLFLANLPGNAVTEVYDTNVDRDRDEQPVKVATVDSPRHTVEILNLRVMSEWLNKKNLNIEAEHPVELILKKQSAHRVTAPENKATAILDLVKGNPFEKPVVVPFTVILKNAEGVAYASLVSDGKDKVKLEVTDFATFKELVARESSPEAQVLRAITLQTKEATAALYGSLEAQAAELVETIEVHIASTHDTAIEERATKAHVAARKRFVEENFDLALLEDATASLEARIDLTSIDEEGPGFSSLGAVFDENVELELEVRQRMMELADTEEMQLAVTAQSIEGVRDLYLEAPEGLKIKLDNIFMLNAEQHQLGDLGATYRAVRKLFLDYHPDKHEGEAQPGYHQLQTVLEALDKLKKQQAQERQTSGNELEGNQTEVLSITTESQQQIPRNLNPKQVDEVDEQDKVEISVEVVVAARVIAAAIASPKIVTGNYSALMACLNDILTDTVAIAPDGDRPSESHIHLIAEPMWLDSVDRSYDNELWGQSIDAFPPAVQKFAKAHIDPAPENGEKLTWGQVRELRGLMLDRIKQDKGFTVYEGQIQNVVEGPRAEAENEKELQINFANGETVTIPFTGQPVVLDLSQRPRPAGPVLSGEPTVLYQQSREKNTTTLSDVPIIVSGSGAQAAWVLDKMGSERSYHISYRGSLDFRIANAILGRDHYTASNALPKVDSPPLSDALVAFADGLPQVVNYTKDDGTKVDLNISVYPGDKATLLKAADIPEELEEARGLLVRAGVKPEDVDTVHAEILRQIQERNEEQELTADELVIQVYKDPSRVDVGFAVNATGWVSLKETVRPPAKFWGESANVSTGDDLVRAANLITTGSLLPGSGLPRMLAIKDQLRAMRTEGEGNTYDVRALAFTGSGFDKMCAECKFPPEFKTELAKAIKQLGTPEDAQPNPVVWIVNEYKEWLEDNIQIAEKDEPVFVALAQEALDNNVAQNLAAERSEIAEEPKQDVVDGPVILARAREQFSFFGGASSRIDRSISEVMRKENLKTMAQQADSFSPEEREKIIEYFKTIPQEELMDIKSESATAQEAWDQQYGLVPRN